MVTVPCIAPHPAFTTAVDPALCTVRRIAAGLNNAPPATETIPGRSRQRRRAGSANARRTLTVQDLANLDVDDLARWFTAHYRHGPGVAYPGVVIGSTNAALAQICTLTRMPWLPQTVMLPLQWEPRCWSSLPAAGALGIQAADAFHGRNPEVALHQSHDEWSGPAAVSGAPRMRAKLRLLPAAYVRFLDSSLATGTVVILLHDESVWPTTRLGQRRVLHIGSRHSPLPAQWRDVVIPDGLSPDAEFGFDPDLDADVARWCVAHGHPLYRVRIPDAQALRPAVTALARYRSHLPVPGVLDVLRVLSDRTEVTVNRCSLPRRC